MKKSGIILLLAAFLLNISGWSLAVSYCTMDESYSVSSEGKSSCCCADPDGKDCCKTHKFEIKKIEDRFVVTGFHLVKQVWQDILNSYPVIVATPTPLFTSDVSFNRNHKYPDSGVSLSILYRSILI